MCVFVRSGFWVCVCVCVMVCVCVCVCVFVCVCENGFLATRMCFQMLKSRPPKFCRCFKHLLIKNGEKNLLFLPAPRVTFVPPEEQQPVCVCVCVCVCVLPLSPLKSSSPCASTTFSCLMTTVRSKIMRGSAPSATKRPGGLANPSALFYASGR